MANATDPNEYKVERDADIEEDLKKYNVDIGATIFEAVELEKVMESNEASSSSDDAASTSGKKSSVKFGDGKANTLIVMQQTTMDIPSAELNDKKKEAIKKKAEKSKADKEDREAERDK